MEKRPRSESLFYHLLVMSIVPIILLTVVITCFSATRFATSMDREVQNGMRDLCNTILLMYDREHPGAAKLSRYLGRNAARMPFFRLKAVRRRDHGAFAR